MKLEYFHYELNLRSPFRLATGSRRHTDIIIVKLFYDSWVGYGEACLPPYLGEDAHSVIAFLNKIDPIRLKMDVPIYETLEYIDGIREGNNAAKAALDIALHDLLGKIKNKSIHELYGLEKPNNVFTSLTIGMGSLKELEQKLKIKLDVKMYKFKLGGENDKKLIEDYLSISNKPFCVDVNQGWSNKELTKLRQDMLDGKRPDGCWKCWHDEDTGKKSMRQSVNESRLEPHLDCITKTNKDLKPLQVKLLAGASCNLACRMCQSHVSSKVHKVWEEVGFETKEPYKYDWMSDQLIRLNAESVRYID